MKTILTIPLIVIVAIMMVPTVNAQVQQQPCNQCPQQQVQPQYVQPQPQLQPQYIQPQAVPVPVPQPQPQGITLQNITAAITAAVDPINKHLVIIDNQILNITTAIKKLQTPPPAPLPPPTNTTQTPPPPPPPSNQGSSCPNQQGGGGPGPMFYQQYPGGQGFFPRGYGPFDGGGHHFNGHHGGNGNN